MKQITLIAVLMLAAPGVAEESLDTREAEARLREKQQARKVAETQPSSLTNAEVKQLLNELEQLKEDNAQLKEDLEYAYAELKELRKSSQKPEADDEDKKPGLYIGMSMKRARDILGKSGTLLRESEVGSSYEWTVNNTFDVKSGKPTGPADGWKTLILTFDEDDRVVAIDVMQGGSYSTEEISPNRTGISD